MVVGTPKVGAAEEEIYEDVTEQSTVGQEVQEAMARYIPSIVAQVTSQLAESLHKQRQTPDTEATTADEEETDDNDDENEVSLAVGDHI